ncbi:MAG: DUF1592 domain-containing protein [Marinagarivorans sp.]|nr:DUF1592 domain-containing protein [Marinagarivorans sp.]
MAKINTRQLAYGVLLAGAASLLAGCAGDGTTSSSAIDGTASSKNSVAQSSSSIQTSSSSIKASSSSIKASSSSTPMSSSSAPSTVFIPPVEVQSTTPVLIMAINAGSTTGATLNGVQYQADAYFTGGQTNTGTIDVVGTSEDAVYLSERYGDFSYAIPVANGNYSVSFDFVETYATKVAQRVFNVNVEGQNMLSGIDIFKSVGVNKPLTQKINSVAVADGNLNIVFQPVAFNAKVTGIVIHKLGVVGGQSHADKGKAIFDAQCKSCHEATSKGVGTKVDESGHDFDSLLVATDAMPPAALEAIFGACDAECAYYTAKYIASVNPFFGRSAPGLEPDVAIDPVDAAPPIMSRLSKAEYNNTVRDLFGITSNPADNFPADLSGEFDNDNQALTFTNDHVAAFAKAASDIATQVVNAASGGARTAISCDLTVASCAQTVISQLGLKVWRRPLSTEELAGLKSLYDSVQSTTNDRKASMTALVRTMLLSPNFVFRPEFDQNLKSSEAKPLTAYELASRMSYFLWSSTPDTQLLEKAANGSLTNDATLRAEVARMLADTKSNALLDNFMMTWLGYREYGKYVPDKTKFPAYTDAIQQSLLAETEAFLNYILKEGRPITEVLNANYTFLNQSVAAYYGVQGISGNALQRYVWPAGSVRKGILGHASALSSHTNTLTTSPVKRGFWVMDRFICDSPPPPSGEIFDQFPVLPENLNPRAKSEAHKDSGAACAGCHAYIDPIGYGMENFNPAGQWQDFYWEDNSRINPSAVLPSGESYSSLVELADILAAKTQVPMCTISYAMSFATGRLFNTIKEKGQPSDYAAVYQVYKNTKDTAHSITDVFTEIVLNPAFRTRRGANSQ